MPDYTLARAICADCGHYLWFDDSLDLESDEDGWVDEFGRPTCFYRRDIGHVAALIGSDLPPSGPAALSPTPTGPRSAGVLF